MYVRFNPHWFEVDGVLHDPPLAAGFERLQRLLVDLQHGRVPEVVGRPGLSLLYLFYDRQTPGGSRDRAALAAAGGRPVRGRAGHRRWQFGGGAGAARLCGPGRIDDARGAFFLLIKTD